MSPNFGHNLLFYEFLSCFSLYIIGRSTRNDQEKRQIGISRYSVQVDNKCLKQNVEKQNDKFVAEVPITELENGYESIWQNFSVCGKLVLTFR